MSKKNTYILFFLSILTFTAGIHKYFVGTGLRADIFLFFDHVTKDGLVGRYVSLIMYEINYMVTALALLITCKYVASSKQTKNIISPFIWIAVLDILDYICFYKQLSYYKLPLLIVLILIYTYKWKKSDKR
jgi:hypothetical protein